MKKWLLIIVGCVVLGVSLLAHLPAQLVLPKESGEFGFKGISGSIWRGEVKQIMFSGKPLPIRGLNWSVSPAALLTGTLKADFHEQQTPVNRGKMDLKLLSRQMSLHGVHWQLSATSIDAWMPLPGVHTRGQFILDLQSLQLPPNGSFPSQLEGQLVWQDAVLQTGPETWPVGSPAAQFSGQGNTINGTVTNSQPVLPGDGTFQCTVTECEATLSLRPTPDTPQSVLNALPFIGLQRSGDKFSGQITLPLR